MRTREELLNTSRGYWQARAVLTAVELGVFPALGRRRLGAEALAKRVGADVRALRMLLDALVGLSVLAKSKTAYSIPKALLPLLTEGEESALGMLRHHAVLWETWSGLTDSVRTGGPQKRETSFRTSPEAARAFTMAMRDGARRLAPGVAEEVPLRGRRLLLDLGGGPGVYAAEFARRNPDLRVVVVDLPMVAEVGDELRAEYPDVRDRIAYHAADLDTDPLPEGADSAFLSHVIHSNDEDQNTALFRKVAAALAPRGLFVVRDFFLSPDGTEPPSASLFSLNMLVNTPRGRSYTAKETAARLREAGFRTVTHRKSRIAGDAGYLLARC